MAPGRNRRIAAWAVVAFMALGYGCAQAATLDLTPATTSLKQVSSVSSVPVLPSALQLPATPAAPPLVATPLPPSTPATAPSAAPAATSPAPSQAVSVRSSRVGHEPSAHTTASRPSAGANHLAASGRTPRARGPHGRRTRVSHAARAKRNQFPPIERSKFDRLGKLVDAGSPSQAFNDFVERNSTTGMGWAVPLLAIMLPIGLCGFLGAARRTDRA
jgi:hypothetical protein